MDELVAGSMFGPYRIEGTLGAGGMGCVYRARDTRLDREVAIKTSNDRFSDRFAQEARAISALNHPHVCTLYDVGPNYLVMELIEGRTLEDRLALGAIEPDEALGIALQVAAGLEAAHEKGVIHRDLKPSNIKLLPNGSVKVLDFGLAKIMQRDETAIGNPNLTQTGTVLGTSGYMAPEQVQGKPVDKRADIWSFGVVLYEMLTGTRPGLSGIRQSAVDAVLASEPRWTRTPRKLQRVIRHCLAENPQNRLRDIGDLRLLLEDEIPERASWSPSRRAFAGALAAAGGAAAFGGWALLRNPAPTAGRRLRLTATLPAGARVYDQSVIASSIALSPDGGLLVVAASGNDGRQLYARRLDELSARPLPGTAGAASPFFSPTGDWIGFYADGRLQRVPAAGGPVVDIAEAAGAPIGASWGPDDRIVFTSGWRSPLYVVPARGGTPTILAPLDPAVPEINMRRPQHLPDGRTVLLDVRHPDAGYVVAIDLDTRRRTVITEGVAPRYVNGRLLIARGTTLLAAPFDSRSLQLTGAAAPLLENVAALAGGTQHLAVSAEGTLAYVVGVERYALVLVDLRNGVERASLGEQDRFHRPRFDPVGGRVCVAINERRVTGWSSDDLWIYDVANPQGTRRFTSDGATGGVWSNDGATLTYAVEPFWTPRPATGLFSRELAGRSSETQHASLTEFHRPIGWTPKGLLFELTTDDGEFRIELLSPSGERSLVVRGTNGRLSLDRRWLAYTSDQRGRDAIYVTDLDQAGSNLIAEGHDPVWGPDNIVYYWFGTRLWSAKINPDNGTPIAEASIVLDSVPPATGGDYDISPDGTTMVLVLPVDRARGREIVVARDPLA